MDPVPESATLTDGLEALLLICSAPETAAGVLRRERDGNTAALPEASVKGIAGLLWLKPVPEMPTLLTVIDVDEPLLSVTVCFTACPD